MPDNQSEKINPVLGRMIKHLHAAGIAVTKADRLMGSGNGRLGKMVANDTVPRDPFIENFLRTFPDVSRQWLTEGIGERTVRLPVIEARPITVMPDPAEFEDTDHKFAYAENETIAMRVRVVPAKAQLGYMRGFADPEWFESFDYEIIPVTKEHHSTYLGFETVGRSMVNLTTDWWADKSIFPNRIAIGRELSRDKWRDKLHIHSNDAWVIVHKTDGILLKEITAHDTATGIITAHSWNPDKEKHPDRYFHLDDIAQLFNVVQVVDKRR